MWIFNQTLYFVFHAKLIYKVTVDVIEILRTLILIYYFFDDEIRVCPHLDV